MKKVLLILTAILPLGAKVCNLPTPVKELATPVKNISQYPDLIRNQKSIKGLCIYTVEIKENGLNWKMLLLFNPKKPKGAFWFLPHDNENSAFDSAIYAAKRYGGGFLSVVTGGQRYFAYQDPNRNFGTTKSVSNRCKRQKYPSPKYVNTVFKIIDTFKDKKYPYLALHNNANGHYKNGGSGTISILYSTPHSQAYPAYRDIQHTSNGGLKDEDTMVYIASTTKEPPKNKISKLNKAGINVKYEWIDKNHNDCSMSNYIVLSKGSNQYYNIETQMGDSKTQKVLIDKLISIIK